MRILINGIGCIPGTGARLLVEEFIKNGGSGHVVVCHLPLAGSESKNNFHLPNNIRVIYLKHKVWGRYLRIAYELYVNLLLLFKRYDVCINFSNYGLCIFGNHLLYFHNLALLDLTIHSGFAQGKPNVIKHWMLNNSLRRAKCVILQADHVKEKLIEYCTTVETALPKKIIIAKPSPFLKSFSAARQKTFSFELFYPSSNTLVKRDKLAAESIHQLHAKNNKVGLIITVGNNAIESKDGVKVLDWLNREEVSAQMAICDALLFTSEAETLGLPLLEALYFGKPAILPDLPYAKEIYGDAAVYFDEPTADEVAKAVIKLTENYELYIERVNERRKFDKNNRISWNQHWQVFLENAS